MSRKKENKGTRRAKPVVSPVFDVRGEDGDVRMVLPVGKDGGYPGAAAQPHAGLAPKDYKPALKTILSQIRLRSSVPTCYNVPAVSCAGMLYRGAKRGTKFPELLYDGLMEVVAHSFREVLAEFKARLAHAKDRSAQVAAVVARFGSLAEGSREAYAEGVAELSASLHRSANTAKKVKEEDFGAVYIEALITGGHVDEAAEELDDGAEEGGGRKKDPVVAAFKAAGISAGKLARLAASPEPSATALKKAVAVLAKNLDHLLDVTGKAVQDAGLRIVMLRDWMVAWKANPPPKKGGSDVTVAVTDDHTPKAWVEVNGTLKAEQGGNGHLFAHPEPGVAAFSEGSYGGWNPAEVAAPLKASGGYAGGGSETLVMQAADTWCMHSGLVNRSEHAGPNGSGFGRELCNALDTGSFPHVLMHEDEEPAEMEMAEDLDGKEDMEMEEMIEGFAESAKPEAVAIPADDTHPEVTGTLLSSGAGLDRVGGVASEKDLVVAHRLDGKSKGPHKSKDHGMVVLSVPEVGSGDVAAALRDLEEMADEIDEITAVCPRRHRIRRLTTIETARLQGMPDAWAVVRARQLVLKNGVLVRKNSKMTREEAEERRKMWLGVGLDFSVEEIMAMVSDASIYKMHGNSMSVPVIRSVLTNLVKAFADWAPDSFGAA